MSLLAVITILQSLAVLLIGLIAYIRNHNKLSNLAFLLLSLLIAIWIPASSFGGRIDNNDLSIFLVYLDFISGFLVAWTFWLFSFALKREFISKKANSIVTIILSLTPLLLGLTLLTNQIEIKSVGDEIVYSETQSFILTYIAPILLLVGSSLANLRHILKRVRNEYKNQISAVSRSLLYTTVLVVPATLGGTVARSENIKDLLQVLANFGLLVFVAGLSIAILKHRLFDVRSFIVRSVTYSFSFATISVLYIVISYLVLSTVFVTESLSLGTEAFLVGLTILIAASFQPIKNLFNRVASKVFYRDYYDPQTQLNKLSEIIVAEYEINELIAKSAKIINETVRPAHSKVILLDEKGDFYDEYDSGKSDINAESALEILKDQKEDDLIIDEISESQAESRDMGKLVSYLRKADVSVSLKLFTSDETVGYMLLGPKLSGSTFSSQDIRFLSIASNELSVALQNARRFDQIRRFNETLRLEVDRATAELVRSNEKLRELDEAKDEFVTMASHQLRTPLTSVKGYISMVMEGDAGKISKKQKELLGNAFTSSQRMVYLISDLLNVSRLKTGKFSIEKSSVNLAVMVKSEVEQLRETAKARKIRINYKAPKKFPNLSLDENKTRQVVMNFIDNAIYYTPSGGKIDVELKKGKKQVELRVKDNGIGVPKNERHKLFNKFYRAENARKARPDGTGLGLFMAKKVVVAQGGAMIFESDEGKGSTFGFSFPLSRVSLKSKSTKKSKKKAKKTKDKE